MYSNYSIYLIKKESILMKKKFVLFLSFVIVVFILFLSQVTIFVIPPLKILPKGKIVIIWKTKKTNFIDSPEAMCLRITGNTNTLCRAMVMAKVLDEKNIILRLPYNEYLYKLSFKGK